MYGVALPPPPKRPANGSPGLVQPPPPKRQAVEVWPPEKSPDGEPMENMEEEVAPPKIE